MHFRLRSYKVRLRASTQHIEIIILDAKDHKYLISTS